VDPVKQGEAAFVLKPAARFRRKPGESFVLAAGEDQGGQQRRCDGDSDAGSHVRSLPD
jgi:hypothetical protein